MVGSFIQFVRNLESVGFRKKGRKPVFNANQFYPFALERELQQATVAEFQRALEENITLALSGESFGDSLEELMNDPKGLPKEFTRKVEKVATGICSKVTEDFARQSEMTIGQPYFPPATKAEIMNTWEQNFQNLCISAESDAKKEISRIVSEGKMKGWNKKQVEAAVREKLPAETKHRAELIARTETAKLNSAARIEQYKEVGIKYYVWMTTIDGRERENHKNMNNRICSVSDPTVWYEETENGLVEHQRNASSMYIGNPGEDFQCRCSMVSWDPEIDGKFEVKGPTPEELAEMERQERERKEREMQERLAKEAAEREAREKAERELAEQRRKVEILQMANKRHSDRTQEHRQSIIKKLNERLEIRKIAKKVIAEAEGINGIGLESLNTAMNGGSPKHYAEMKSISSEIQKKIEELKNLRYVENGIDLAKKFSYDEIIIAEKAIESKVNKWSLLPLSKQKINYEYEVDYVEKFKKYSTWEIAKKAYEKKLFEVNNLIKWDDLSNKLDSVISYSKTTSSKQLKVLISAAQAAKQNNNLTEFTQKVLAAEFKKDSLEKNKLYKQAKNHGASLNNQQQNASSKKLASFGISNGKQIMEMPATMGYREQIDAVKLLCNVDETKAKDFISAVEGFSFKWDYEIRAYQTGTPFSPRGGHTMDQVKKKAEDIEEFINKSPKWAGGDTYRGMSLSQKSIYKFINNYNQGVDINMLGAASFSTQESTAVNFSNRHIGETDSNGDIMTEKAIFLQPNGQPLGTSIRHLSQFGGEHEILTSNDARWKITNYRKDPSGIHYFTLDAL